MNKQLKEQMNQLSEEELLFQLESQVGDLATYYADRFANRAKKEVFDDIEKECPSPIWEMLNKEVIIDLKKRHLSTSQSEGTELSFKVPSQSSDKLCPKCHKESLLFDSQGKGYCGVISCDYSDTGITRL